MSLLETGRYTIEQGTEGVKALILTADPQEVPFDPPINIIGQLTTKTDAEYPFPNWNRPLSQIEWITIHHSAGSRDTQNIQWWHRYHTEYKSWSRVGYHFGVSRLNPGEEIKLFQMNEMSWLTWHDGRNKDTLGLCVAGDMRAGYDVRPNELQVDLMAQFFVWVVPQLKKLFAIVGHKRFGSTQCPGDMKAWMPEVIERTKDYGLDIEPLVSYRTLADASAVGRAMSVVGSAFTSIATGGYRVPSPKPSGYNEDEGIGHPHVIMDCSG